MRRLVANLTLAGILCLLLPSPALAFVLNQAHACCLRSGKHYCQTPSKGEGFQATKELCPHTAELLRHLTPVAQTSHGVFASLVSFATPGPVNPGSPNSIATNQPSQRGPPQYSSSALSQASA